MHQVGSLLRQYTRQAITVLSLNFKRIRTHPPRVLKRVLNMMEKRHYK